jgi:hypothetical protein
MNKENCVDNTFSPQKWKKRQTFLHIVIKYLSTGLLNSKNGLTVASVRLIHKKTSLVYILFFYIQIKTLKTSETKTALKW